HSRYLSYCSCTSPSPPSFPTRRSSDLLRLQTDPTVFFKGIVGNNERILCTLCNPPFHSSAAEATRGSARKWRNLGKQDPTRKLRSEEHTSELQSRFDIVCRLLLEKKKN